MRNQTTLLTPHLKSLWREHGPNVFSCCFPLVAFGLRSPRFRGWGYHPGYCSAVCLWLVSCGRGWAQGTLSFPGSRRGLGKFDFPAKRLLQRICAPRGQDTGISQALSNIDLACIKLLPFRVPSFPFPTSKPIFLAGGLSLARA